MDMERTKHEFIWIFIFLFLSETCIMDINGKLPTFFYLFWSERYLKVRVNSTFSDIHEQEMGVPIGNDLSVILYNIKIKTQAKVWMVVVMLMTS